MDIDIELIKGTLSLMILSLLSREPMYGYQIVTTVRQDSNGVFDWKEGSLYPSLHKLERDGLVRGKWQGKSGSRRRKYYQLTEAGRAALAKKIESWQQLCRNINQVLEKSHERH